MNNVQLARKIADEVKKGNYVAGHAIFRGRKEFFEVTPDKILIEGLNIQDASKGVPFTSRRFDELFEECLDDLCDLAKNSSNAVVIINIPGELIMSYDKNCFTSLDSSSILLEPTDKLSDYYTDAYGKPTHIALLPSQYIEGYLDVNENLFIGNPNYAFNNDDRQLNISILRTLFDNKYEKISADFNKSRKQYAPIKVQKRIIT